MKYFEIISVNRSEHKGTIKNAVDEIQLTPDGIENDAHAGRWHRQVSLLGIEDIRQAEITAKVDLPAGSFAENITTEGIELHQTQILDRFVSENADLEVTQIGKKCHGKCVIGEKIGDCIMPVRGIFARVVKSGQIKPGDRFQYIPKVFKIKVITLSDRAYHGEYTDESGPLLKEKIAAWGNQNRLQHSISVTVIPDEPEKLNQELNSCFAAQFDMIFTTGSTGIGTRDIVPETMQPLLDKEIPGIMEMIRVKYGMNKPNALLSRSIAGIKNKTLVFALPGSPKAVNEYFGEIEKLLFHTILMLHDINKH